MSVVVVVLLSLTLKYFLLHLAIESFSLQTLIQYIIALENFFLAFSSFCVLYFQYICLLPPVIPMSLWRTSLFHLFPPLSSLSQQYCALSHRNYSQHRDVVKIS